MRRLFFAATLLGSPLAALYMLQHGDQIGAVYCAVWLFAGLISWAIEDTDERIRWLFALSIVAGAAVLVLIQQDSLLQEFRALELSHARRYGIR